MRVANPQVSVAFKRPFDEQVAFFRGKLGNLVPTATWRDLWKAEHDRAFMVAGASKADLLADLAAAVDKAIVDGETIQAFRARFGEIVRRHGWHGWTGEGTKAGEAWRTRVIYETNLSTSYAAGRYAQLQQGEYPYWMYQHSDAVVRPRPQHVAWDGLVLPSNHKFWRTHFPPNGFGCRCTALGVRSPAQAQRLGGDPDKPLPPNWDTVDPQTGAPIGIDEGWDYAPGAAVSDTVRTAARKIVNWDYRLARAYMEDVPSAQRDALATAIRSQPETGEAVRRYARRVLEKLEADVPPYQTMGPLSTEEATRIAALTKVPLVERELFEWTIDLSTINKVLKAHGADETEVTRGQDPITAEDYALLPRLLVQARAADFTSTKESGIGRPAIEIVTYFRGRRYGAVFEVRQGRHHLALQTFYKGKAQ
jgi:hypothetical protein